MTTQIDITQRLQWQAENPMWDAHAEVRKDWLMEAVEEIGRLRRRLAACYDNSEAEAEIARLREGIIDFLHGECGEVEISPQLYFERLLEESD